MSQKTILALFLFCLLTNVALWLMGGWLVTQDVKFVGITLFVGAVLHGWLMWEAFASEEDDVQTS